MKNSFKKINKTRIMNALELPKEAFNSIPHIEMTGNNEILIESCKGIVDYDTELIKIDIGKYIIKITGRDLMIRNYTVKNITVSGLLLSVEFII